MLLEICIQSPQAALAAEQGGAGRVELCASLFFGGLTPSAGALVRVKETCSLPVMAMVRPREGGFCYGEEEFAVMLEDARMLGELGADGIVFGCLRPDGRIDWEQCKRLLDVIGDRQSVFHRAFDMAPDWQEALDGLCGLGVTRVLSSGGRRRALDGADRLCQMRRRAGGRIEILPGGGVRPDCARELLLRTGCGQLHASASMAGRDGSGCLVGEIAFSGGQAPDQDAFPLTDAGAVRALVSAMREGDAP